MQPRSDLPSPEAAACRQHHPDAPLTCGQAGFFNDRLWNFPAAGFLIPDGFALDLLQIAVVAVTPDEGLHLIQQLLEEHQVSLQAADGAEVIDLFQLKFRLQIFDLRLGSPQLGHENKVSRLDYEGERPTVAVSTGICRAEEWKDTHKTLSVREDF